MKAFFPSYNQYLFPDQRVCYLYVFRWELECNTRLQQKAIRDLPQLVVLNVRKIIDTVYQIKDTYLSFPVKINCILLLSKFVSGPFILGHPVHLEIHPVKTKIQIIYQRKYPKAHFEG